MIKTPHIIGPGAKIVRAGERPPERVRGLGDVVAGITKAFGFKSCGGCGKRQHWLNQKVPLR